MEDVLPVALVCCASSRLIEKMSRSSVVWLPTVSVVVLKMPSSAARALLAPNNAAPVSGLTSVPLPLVRRLIELALHILKLAAQRAAIRNRQHGARGQGIIPVGGQRVEAVQMAIADRQRTVRIGRPRPPETPRQVVDRCGTARLAVRIGIRDILVPARNEDGQAVAQRVTQLVGDDGAAGMYSCRRRPAHR